MSTTRSRGRWLWPLFRRLLGAMTAGMEVAWGESQAQGLCTGYKTHLPNVLSPRTLLLYLGKLSQAVFQDTQEDKASTKLDLVSRHRSVPLKT